jgi:hypothetical protein
VYKLKPTAASEYEARVKMRGLEDRGLTRGALYGQLRAFVEERDSHGRWTNSGLDPDAGARWDTESRGYPRTDYTPPNTSAHTLYRDGGDWGSSHSMSYRITGRASTIMGIAGYRDQSHEAHVAENGYYSDSDKTILKKTDQVLTQSAQRLVSMIGGDHVGSEEPLYHGYEDRAGTQFHVGDTMRVPPLATAGDFVDCVGYGTHLDKEYQVGIPTVFAFAPGTQMAAYGKWGKDDQKDFGHVYSEAIVAGGFKVTHVELQQPTGAHDLRPVQVVYLKQTESFHPDTGWISR